MGFGIRALRAGGRTVRSPRRSLRRWAVSRSLPAVPLLTAAACGSNVEEVADIVLARHVHTDLYDAYPGIPSPAGDRGRIRRLCRGQ